MAMFSTIITAALITIIYFSPGNIMFNFNAKASTEVNASLEKTLLSSNEILIKLKPVAANTILTSSYKDSPLNTGLNSINILNKALKVEKMISIAKESKNSNAVTDVYRWFKIKLPGERKNILFNSTEYKFIEAVVNVYKVDPNIEYAEPNYVVQTTAVPNDPFYQSSGSWGQSYQDLWGLHKINAKDAWDKTTGSKDVVVAVVDTGIDRTHPDLKDNIWSNSNEIQGNNIDDDNNGYTDDYYGWDFEFDDPDPIDDTFHGTHVAGTIAGTGNNNLGITGVAWKAKIMSAKFLGSQGGYMSQAIEALIYTANMGAKLASNSWGCSCNSKSLEDAMSYLHGKGMVVVAAAGNENYDSIYFSPASIDEVITVSASDSNDAKANFSNFGLKTDVIAPGVDILSTKSSRGCTTNIVGDYYCRLSGTSMSAPHVTGLAALIWSKNPNLTNEQVRQILRTTSFDLGAMGRDKDFAYGRIDAKAAVDQSDSNILAPFIKNPKSRALLSGQVTLIGGITGNNFKNYKIEIANMDRVTVGDNTTYTSGLDATNQGIPIIWKEIINSNTQVLYGSLANFNTNDFTPGYYTILLTAYDLNDKQYQFQIYNVKFNDTQILPTSLYPPSGLNAVYIGARNAQLSWGLDSAQPSLNIAGFKIYRNNTLIGVAYKNDQFGDNGLEPNTSYTYYVTAYDSYGNESDKSNEITVKTYPGIDNIPPTAPTSLHSDSQTDTRIIVSWKQSTDDTYVKEYKVFRDNQLISTGPPQRSDTEYVDFYDSNLVPNTLYTYYIVAIDSYNKESVPSSTFQVRTKASCTLGICN